MANQRILLFGGTFDPIHNAHLAIARSVAQHLATEKIILIPAGNPPHKDNEVVTDANLRFQMCQVATADEPLFEVSDCEMLRRGPSYTITSILNFYYLYGWETSLFWLIGADSIADLPGWHRIKELVESCTIVTARRPGSESPDFTALKSVLTKKQIAQLKANCLPTPLLDISATDIRHRVRHNQPITDLVGAPVAALIRQNHLYTDHE